MKNRKIILLGNLILYMIIGGVIGFILTSFFMNNHEILEIQLTKAQTNLIVAILAIIYVMLVILLYSVYYKAEKLRKAKTTIENEDSIEEQIERTLVYPSVLLGLIMSIALMILNVTLNVAVSTTIFSTIIALITLFLTAPFSYMHLTKMRKIYPERNFPRPGDKKMNEKMVEMMDSGEQYITLLALQKTYSLNQQLIIVFIAISSIYSIASNNNQFLSVSLMIILLLVNTIYFTKKISEAY